MAYTVETRKKALAALEKGYTRADIRNIFGLGLNTLRTWENLRAETGSLENRVLNRTPRKIDRLEKADGLRFRYLCFNREQVFVFRKASAESGAVTVRVNGQNLPVEEDTPNPYRHGGIRIHRSSLPDTGNELEIIFPFAKP